MDRKKPVGTKVVSTIDGIVPGGDKNLDWGVLRYTFDPEKPDKAFEVISKLPPAMIQTTPFSIASIFTKRLARSDGELERHEALESYLRSAYYTTNFVRFAYFSMVLQGDSRDMSPFQGVLLRERLVPLLNQERPPLVYNNQDREYLERIYWGVRCGVWLDDAFVPAPDQLDNFIRTALNQKKNSLLKFLVEKFNPILVDVFIEAFATGNTTIMRWLMETRNVRVTDEMLAGEGKRATRNALQFCYLEALRLILEAGATPAFIEQVYRSSKRIDMGNPELYRFFQDECHLDIPQPIDGDEERPLVLSPVIPLKERLNILLNDYHFNQFVELATKEWNSGVTLNLPSSARYTYRVRNLIERHRAAFPLLYLEEALQYRWEDREVFQAMRKNRTPFHMVDDLLEEEDYRTHLPHLVYLAVAISRIDILAYLAAIGADIGPIYAHPHASVAVIQWMMQRNPLPTPADIRKAINETKRADVRFFLRQQSYDDDEAEPPMRRIADAYLK